MRSNSSPRLRSRGSVHESPITDDFNIHHFDDVVNNSLESTKQLTTQVDDDDDDDDDDSNTNNGDRAALIQTNRHCESDFSDQHEHEICLPHIKLSAKQMAGLSTYWFGWAALWIPLIVVIIPSQIVTITGDDGDIRKGENLSGILMTGSAFSLFCLPLFGALSDTCTHSLGRRRPFMITGCFFATLAVFMMSLNPVLPVYSIAFLVLSICNNAIMAPFSGLVPDLVPPSQHGVISSWLGGMSMLGYLVGGLMSLLLKPLGVTMLLMILNFIHGISMYITVTHTIEIPLKAPQPSFSVFACCFSLLKPMKHLDFFLLFASRFFMQMGIATVQQFMSFYVQDAIERPYAFHGHIVADNAQSAVSILLLPLIIGAVISSSVSGVLSDLIGGRRKVIVYWSGILMAFGATTLAITRSYSVAMCLGFVFGLGYGAFASVDWAMVTDILPNSDEFAKDMGVWSLALVLPNIFMPLTGCLLDSMQAYNSTINLGYILLFMTAAIEIGTGTYLVKFIRNIR